MLSVGNTCRLCLATDAPVHVIAGTPLQDIYEKLTEISLNTPRRSVVACHLCYSQLRNCHDLMVRSVRADKVLTQILQNGNMDEEEFVAMIKQYRLNDGLCVTPTKLITVTNTEDSLIKDDIKEEPQPAQSRGVMTMELIELDKSKDKGDTEKGAPVDIDAMDSEEFINKGDVKIEVLEEPLNDKRHELKIEDIKLEAFEGVQNIATERLIEKDTRYVEIELIGHDDSEGAAPNNTCKKTGDTTTLTPCEENMGTGKRRAVLEEKIWSRNTGTCMLRSTRNSGNKTRVSRDVSTCVDTAINKDNSSVNSDYDCTSIKTDVDNSSRERLKKVVISDECGDVSHDKYLLVEHRNVTRTSNRTSGEGSSHQRTLLQKQKCGRTGIVNKYTDTRRGKKLFECDVCQRRFTRKCDYNYHLRTHTGENPFECEICQKKLYKKSDLKNHFRIHTGEKPFECNICKSKFSLKSTLNVHLKTHTGEKPFKCNICKSKFSQNSHLKVHLRTHTGEKPFECNICKSKFSQKSYLKLHFRIHTGEKPFECDMCQAKFTKKSHLNNHFMTHTGEKSFECDICKSKFSRNGDLKAHFRTHTGEKPFECNICKSKFSLKSTLNVHLRTHTGEKPFKCNICEKKFREKGQLNIHLITHTGEKPFECEICKRKFSLKGNLKTHLRTHTDE